MKITIEQFQDLIDATRNGFIDYLLQVAGIVVPLIFAYIVAKVETRKATKEESQKNKVLDERQRKLEEVQISIAESIKGLSDKYIELIDTQEKVERNLKELKKLSEQARQANLLTLQNIYREFFDHYKEFELDVKKLESLKPKFTKGLTWSCDDRDRLLEVYRKIKHPNIRFLSNEKIPMLVLEEFEKLNRILWENTMKASPKVEDIFDDVYDEFISIFEEFKRKLYQEI